MANWCRTVLRVLGPEPDIARFAALVAQDEDDGDEEEGSLIQLAEICEMERSPGRAKFEVLTKWRPPLEALAALSREFPALRFQADWQEPGCGLVGCAVVADGTVDVCELDDLLWDAENRLRESYRRRHVAGWEENEVTDIDTVEWEFEWGVLQEVARQFFGEREAEAHDAEKPDWREAGF